MTGIQSLNNFFFDDNRSLKAWKAYNVGQFFLSSQQLRFGTPHGVTNIDIVQLFSTPTKTVEAGVFTAVRRAEKQALAEESCPS